MRKVLLLGALLLIQLVSLAQQLYSTELGIDEAVGIDLLPTEDGGALLSARHGSDALLVRWNGDGDTLWTARRPWQQWPLWSMAPLHTGELICTGYNQAVVFTDQGDIVESFPIAGSNAVEFGNDSILSSLGDNVQLTARGGGLIWERPVVSRVGATHAPGLIVPVTNGYVIAGATSDFGTASTVQLSRYDRNGLFVDSLTLRADAGSIAGARMAARCADGGALIGMIHGTGNAILVRIDTEGDTLWTRIFGFSSALPGYPAFFDLHDGVERSDGTFVLSGIGGWPVEGAYRHALLELDAQGGPICVEELDTWPYPPHTRIVRDADDRLHVLVSGQGGPMEFDVRLDGFAELCLPTTLPAPSLPELDVQPRITDAVVRFIMPDALPRPVEVYDATGRKVLRGAFVTDGALLDLGSLRSGVYLIDVHGSAAPVRVVKQ